MTAEQQEAARREEAAKAEAEAAAKKRAEEDAILAAVVVHEEPMRVRPYASTSMDATLQEVRQLTVRRSRPLVRGPQLLRSTRVAAMVPG